jgi:hypothetical protein
MLVGKRVVLIAGATTVLMVGGGVAGAAIASGPVASGVIHACYITKASSSGGHAIAVENSGKSCPRGTTALTWNQIGPKGATGPKGTIGLKGDTGPKGDIGPTGPPGSNAVYGRIIGVDFGARNLYLGAPSGVVAASTSDLLSEQLSAASSLSLTNLQVQLVQPGSDTADPVPAQSMSPFPQSVLVLFVDQDGNINGCEVSPGASTCSLSTIGTIPAGSLLGIGVSLRSLGGPPTLLSGYTPDVVFNYTATASS